MLSSGGKIGQYEIISLLGAGGMGEVYRAKDTRLNRDVALKVLPQLFASDAQRMARFEREAKMLASLNHPNIAAIYGLEESGPIRALVMELVEGPTLADRIRTGAIPLEEALPIARQIAEAVEYAHDKNVIHRDLKPANIKVTVEGTVKVLDFGLAKAMSEETAEADMSNSPTLSMAATRQGMILGTAAYMAPEQAKGKPVDRRADVWAFGAVLYEMLTGKQAFQGEDITEILAAVVRADPDWKQLPATASQTIHNLLRRCLEKNPKRRLAHIGEARILIEDVLSGVPPVEPAAQVAVQQPKGFFGDARLAWGIAVVAILAGLAVAVFTYLRPAPIAAEAIRFFIAPPESWTLRQVVGRAGASPAPLAVSPDGRRVAFVGQGAGGKIQIWVHSLDALDAQALAGTEDAVSPFWSPDSRFLGFVADGKLKKIDVSGGPPITLCDAVDAWGGTWNRDGIIVFAGAPGRELQKVAAAGGVPTAATTLGQGEVRHLRPFFLPDGRHFLYGVTGGPVFVASLDSSERKLLLNADSSNVLYSQGHLLYLRETTLMAQPFDAQRLEFAGDPFPVADEIRISGTNPGTAFFSVSENGVLAYHTGLAGGVISTLAWFDRSGTQLGALGTPDSYGDVHLSADGKQASVSIVDPVRRTRDIWIYDVLRSLKSRFTFEPGDEFALTWSPDGKRVILTSRRKQHMDLYQRLADGSGTEETLLEDDTDKFYLSWSPDGRSLLYGTGNATPQTGNDLLVLPLLGERKPVPFLKTQFNELFGQFSPDGRWVLYYSNESGRSEVYVAPYPGPGGKRQVSTAGGSWPRWRRDGTEIFYRSPDSKLMVATVNGKGASFEVGAVTPLFEARFSPLGRSQYDVSPDGQRFLINIEPEQAAQSPITIVVNWTAGLKK